MAKIGQSILLSCITALALAPAEAANLMEVYEMPSWWVPVGGAPVK